MPTTFSRALTTSIALVLTCLSLAHCTSLPTERKAQIKRLLVINEVPAEVTRYFVGITVFTNIDAGTSPLPELAPRLKSDIRKILAARLPGVQVTFAANGDKVFAGLKSAGQFEKVIASLAAKAGADTVLVVPCVKWAPTGAPGSMTAKVGLWQRGVATTDLCCMPTLREAATGKTIGVGWPVGHPTMIRVPWKDRFADYTPAERQLIVDGVSENLCHHLEAQLNHMKL